MGAYPNGHIADEALSRLGQNGGECREFVNSVVSTASGGSQNTGQGWPDYFVGFELAGGTRITNIDDLRSGDIVQIGQTEANPSLHTTIIVSRVSGSRFIVVDSNSRRDHIVRTYERTIWLDEVSRAYRLGTTDGSPGGHDLVDGDLYRIGSGAEVYVVIGGAKFHITNPDELQRRLNNGDGPIYSVSQAAHDALGTVPRDGTLFRNEDSLQQYFVVAPAAMPVNSGDVGPLRSEGVDTDNVQVAPPGLSNVLGSVPRAGVVIRGAGGVELWYIDSAGQRRQIPRAAPTNDRVLTCRLGTQQVLLAPGGALNALPEGPWGDCRNHMVEDQATGAVSFIDEAEERWSVGNPAIRDCLAGRRGVTGPVRVSATVINSFPTTGRAAYCPYSVGSLVRGAGQPQVWLIRSDGHREHVATERAIACHGGYGNLSVVPAGEVDGHVLDGPASDGCSLRDRQLLDRDTGAVSFIDSDGRRWPVSSPVIRDCLAVRAGTGQPISVYQSVIAEFSLVPERQAYCPYPVGSLVRGAGQAEVWHILPDGRRAHVPDAQTVACLGGEVAEVPTGEVDGHELVGTAMCPTGVSGQVTETGSGAPVAGAWVAVLRTSDYSVAGGAAADGSGNFTVPVAAGSYYLYVVDPSGAHTAGFHGPPTTVTVTSGAMTDADPQMASTRGAVAGTVTEAGSGTPVGGAWVIGINATTGATQQGVVANGAGEYNIGGLRAGSYRPVFVDPTGAHGSRYFPNSVDFLGATSLAVTAGGSTAANVALPTQSTTPGAATLSGTVREAGSDTALGGVFVVALRASDFRNAGGAVTNGSGQYSLNVAAGDYKLAFVDSTGLHDMEWHDNQPNTGLATASSVTAPAVTNAALDANTGTMAGTITDDPSGNPLGGAWVVAIGPTGAIAGGAVTAADGTYTLAGLAPGTYRATFVDPNGGRTQEYFNNSPDYAGATPINVTVANTNTINANLHHP